MKGVLFFDRRYTKRVPFLSKISGGSRPSDKGGFGVGGYLDPETRGQGGLKKSFQPFGPQFGLKIRGAGPSPGNSIQKGKGLDLWVETAPRGRGKPDCFQSKTKPMRENQVLLTIS